MNNSMTNSEEKSLILEVAQAPVNDDSANTETGSIGTALPIALSIFGVIIFIWFLNTFLQICKPNEILILSGRKRRTKEGQQVGYRVIFGDEQSVSRL